MRVLFFCLLFTLSNSIFAQSSKEFYNTIDTLCSPFFHGRSAGLKGDSLASEYLADQYRAIGLEPIEGSYFQSFNYPVNIFESDLSVKLGRKLLSPGVDYIPTADCGTGKGKLKVLRYPRDIGKIKEGKEYAFVLDFQKEPLDEAYKNNIKLFINESDGKLVMPVGGRASSFPIIQLKKGVLTEKSKKIKYNIHSELRDHSARNVVGKIEGESDSVIVICAHYDHCGTLGSELYFPGANDNASGTALILEMAKYYKQQSNKYTYVFIAFAGEEAGLIGSKYFVNHPMVDLLKVKMVMNIDLMGSGSEGITVVNAYEQEGFVNHLSSVNDSLTLMPSIKSRGQAANSDHYYFSKQNVPAVFIYARGRVGGYHDIFDVPEELEKDGFQSLFLLFTETLDTL